MLASLAAPAAASADTQKSNRWVSNTTKSGYVSASWHLDRYQLNILDGEYVDCGGDYWVTLRLNYSKITSTAMHVTTALVSVTANRNFVSAMDTLMTDGHGDALVNDQQIRNYPAPGTTNKTYQVNQAVAFDSGSSINLSKLTFHTKDMWEPSGVCIHSVMLRVQHT